MFAARRVLWMMVLATVVGCRSEVADSGDKAPSQPAASPAEQDPIETLSAQIDANPGEAGPYRQRADHFFKANDFEKAIQD